MPEDGGEKPLLSANEFSTLTYERGLVTGYILAFMFENGGNDYAAAMALNMMLGNPLDGEPERSKFAIDAMLEADKVFLDRVLAALGKKVNDDASGHEGSS